MTPRFKVVRTAQIRPLMDYDEEKVLYLIETITETEAINVPLPLLKVDRNEYLLLQDSAMLEAAKRLEILSLPAQINNLRNVLEVTAEIYSEGFTPDLIEKFIIGFPRETAVCNGKKDIKGYPDHVWLGITVNNEPEIFLGFRMTGCNQFSTVLFDFFEFVGKHCRYTQSIYNGHFRTANLKQSRHWSRLRLIDPDVGDLKYAGHLGYKFPATMLHFNTGYRIIGIDFPVNILNEKVPSKEKERFLRDLISFRFRTGHPEFIGSGVFLLNTPFKK